MSDEDERFMLLSLRYPRPDRHRRRSFPGQGETLRRAAIACALLLIASLATGCGASAMQIIPTDPPTATPTATPTLTRTPGRDATPTPTDTPIPASPTGGPSPTSIFGPTSTRAPDQPTATRVVNPNAPRIEYFTSDVVAVVPGETLTLFWSTRNVDRAIIYRLDASGQRNQVWNNLAPDGSLAVGTRRSDRGQVDFVLSVGDGPVITEARLSVPLACPEQWFFQPPPDECPNEQPQLTTMIEGRFERGRMLYIRQSNLVYALFNDGQTPAWISFENRYNPAVHPEMEAGFQPPPGFYQPTGILGFGWRGRDVVRNRLGLALEPGVEYEGTTQTANTPGGQLMLYATSADGTVLQLLPGGAAWQIITTP
jgi:hypothetical protein